METSIFITIFVIGFIIGYFWGTSDENNYWERKE